MAEGTNLFLVLRQQDLKYGPCTERVHISKRVYGRDAQEPPGCLTRSGIPITTIFAPTCLVVAALRGQREISLPGGRLVDPDASVLFRLFNARKFSESLHPLDA